MNPWRLRTFIDYSAAFDTVSHKYVDNALKKQGRSTDKNPRNVQSDLQCGNCSHHHNSYRRRNDKIRRLPNQKRSTKQGVITSPLYFILALELLLRTRTHDECTDTGVSLMNIYHHPHTRLCGVNWSGWRWRHQPSFEKSHKHIKRLERRCWYGCTSPYAIYQKQKLYMSGFKIQYQKPLKVTPRRFVSSSACIKQSLLCVKAWSKLSTSGKTTLRLIRSLTTKAQLVTGRKYLIHCKNYFHEWGSWVPRTNLHPDMIKEYELKTGSYVQNWPHRCPQCDIPCAYARGIKIHISKAHKPNMEKPQDFKQRQACWCGRTKTEIGRTTKVKTDYQMRGRRTGKRVSIQILEIDVFCRCRTRTWPETTNCNGYVKMQPAQQHIWFQIHLPPPETASISSCCLFYTNLWLWNLGLVPQNDPTPKWCKQFNAGKDYKQVNSAGITCDDHELEPCLCKV